jgi:hypothetical protein
MVLRLAEIQPKWMVAIRPELLVNKPLWIAVITH